MGSIQTTGRSAEHIAQVIFAYASKISKEQDVSNLIALNADLARDLAGADRCSLWLVDEEAKELWTRVAHGLGTIRIPLGQGIVGSCIAQGEILLVNDAESDQRFFREIDDSKGYKTRSVLCVPLRDEKGIIGALQLLNKPNGFSEEDSEVVRLAAAYAASAIQAERLRQEAEAAGLLRHEVAIAASVQQRLFPQQQATFDGLEFTGLCRPARFVGGDYYDFLQLAEDCFALTLGDVSGKGLPAAILMASIQTLLRALLRHNPEDLGGAITELNDAIYNSSTPDRYSTLFCAALSATRNQMTYVNAGHIPPFIVRTTGKIERPSQGDVPVGLMPSIRFQQHVVQLDPGDLIVCVSDGVLEAQTSDGELWEESNFESILRDCRHAPVKDVAERLLRAVDAFVGSAEQFDDITIIVVRPAP